MRAGSNAATPRRRSSLPATASMTRTRSTGPTPRSTIRPRRAHSPPGRPTRRSPAPRPLAPAPVGPLVRGLRGVIEAALRCDAGVREAAVQHATRRALVVWDPSRTRLSALIGAVRAAGYDAVPDAAAPARALRLAEERAALWRLFVAVFCMMQVMMYAAPAYFAEPGIARPGSRAAAAVGELAAQHPGRPVLGRTDVPRGAGTACANGASAWTCRSRSASPSPSSRARPPRSIRPDRSAARPTSTR